MARAERNVTVTTVSQVTPFKFGPEIQTSASVRLWALGLLLLLHRRMHPHHTSESDLLGRVLSPRYQVAKMCDVKEAGLEADGLHTHICSFLYILCL